MNADSIRVFLGYTSREPVIFHVASHSIHTRASMPVQISPVMLSQLTKTFNRERNPLQSTDFSFSRFLVPYLCNFEGWAIFADNDIICVEDIKELWDLRDDKYAVMCVQHDHKPKSDTKFLGEKQTQYEKKNWSSVMLLNCAKCTSLTPEYVNTRTGLELHRFQWLENEDLIGEIPKKWNHLVDWDPEVPEEELGIIHYTEGGPYFKETRDCGYADLWQRELNNMLSPPQNALIHPEK
jgi:lipopolysaccharide biosynthesis glycosyltransferase